MTVVVAIKCQDGVVIGSDSMLTHSAGNEPIGSQKATKVQVLEHARILAYAGTPGFAQRACAIATQFGPTHDAKHPIEPSLQLHAALRNHLTQAGVKIPVSLETVFAYPVESDLICSIASADLQPTVLDGRTYFYALGSGSFGALPFLRFLTDIFCPDGPPTLQMGRFLASWAITFACNKTPRFCALPMQMAVLSRGDAGGCQALLFEEEDLQEHADFIESAEAWLRDFAHVVSREAVSHEGHEDLPEAPR